MSAKYPIISVTGSSGTGTTSVRRTFEQIFRRERIEAAYIEGDATSSCKVVQAWCLNVSPAETRRAAVLANTCSWPCRSARMYLTRSRRRRRAR